MKYFFDGGAHIGETFEEFLIPHGYTDHHIVCFEPSPRHYPQLLERLHHYAPRFRGITLCPFALGPHYGVVPVHYKTDSRADSLDRAFWTNAPMPYSVMTAVVPLSICLLALTKPTDTVEIKLDVEGAEFEILAEFLTQYDRHRFSGWPAIVCLHLEWHTMTGNSPSQQRELETEIARLGLSSQPWSL
jgi:FkbM family methyltransferase